MAVKGEIKSHRDLHVWQRAMDLAVNAYSFSKTFPASETYGMMSQIRRAAVSIPANIAEGYGRNSTGAYVNFLQIAQGSLKELETHIELAERVGLSDKQDADVILQSCDELGRMLASLVRSLKQGADRR